MTKILEAVGIWIGIIALLFFVYESVTLRSQLADKTTRLEIAIASKEVADKNLKDCLSELKSTTTVLQQTDSHISVLEGKISVYKEALSHVDKVEKGKK